MLATTYSITLVRAAAMHVMLLHQWKSQRQLTSYFHYPPITGILDLSETCPTQGPTEDESLGCRPFISPQHLWLSHLFGTNYLSRKSYFVNKRLLIINSHETLVLKLNSQL